MISDVRSPDWIRGGQAYWMDGTVEYVNKDGRRVDLTVWKSFCCDCGAVFKFTGLGALGEPRRRCQRCKGAGRVRAGHCADFDRWK